MIIQIEGLKKQFPGFLLSDISMELEPGYIMGLIGPNGSGKTTTIKLLMGLLNRDGGSIRICGKNPDTHGAEIRQSIGFVYDENCFFEEATLIAMKNYMKPFYKKWDDALFSSYMELFELPGNKKIKELSKGMGMKYRLALALSHHAELILLDEPTSGLDPVCRQEILEILQEVISDGSCSVLFSTHITSDLEKIADSITFLSHGQRVFSEDKDSLLDRYSIVKGDPQSFPEILHREGIGLLKDRYCSSILAADKKAAVAGRNAGLLVEPANLEDIVLYYTREHKRKGKKSAGLIIEESL